MRKGISAVAVSMLVVGRSMRLNLTLAESQKAAVAMALGSKMLVVTGGPGVGNITMVNAILRILSAKGLSLLLCAPTGHAAKCA